jgi:hypothetical protein
VLVFLEVELYHNRQNLSFNSKSTKHATFDPADQVVDVGTFPGVAPVLLKSWVVPSTREAAPMRGPAKAISFCFNGEIITRCQK